MLQLTKDAVQWAKRNANIAICGVVVSVGAVVVTVLLALGPTKHEGPIGIVVNVVPMDPIGGAGLLPVAGGTRPSAYLPAGQSLYVDCLQLVQPSYLLARISDGPCVNHWIDVFDIRTPRGEDVRHLHPLLPPCGAPVTLGPLPSMSP